MREQILSFCKQKEQEATAAQDLGAAQNYHDMHAMWVKRFEQNQSKAA